MIKCFDMDGVLAKFYNDKQCLSKMYQQHYFNNLKPYALVDYVNECVARGEIVLIVSACVNSPYCKQEKLDWCKQYLPHLQQENILLINCGQSKQAKVQSWAQQHNISTTETFVLIDDYGKNLEEWCGTNYIPIKYFNGRNHTKQKTYPHSFKTVAQLRKIIDKLNSVGE